MATRKVFGGDQAAPLRRSERISRQAVSRDQPACGIARVPANGVARASGVAKVPVIRAARLPASGVADVPATGASRGTATGCGSSVNVLTPRNSQNVTTISDLTNALSQVGFSGNGQPSGYNSTPSAFNAQKSDTNNNVGLASRRSPDRSPLLQRATVENALLKNFETGNCQFCYMDLKPEEGVMIRDCLHVFCRDCLSSTIEMQEDAQVKCPVGDERGCGGFITDAEVKELVSPDIYQKYLDRSLVVARKKMKNIFNCQTAGCAQWCEFEDGRKTFNCPGCGHTSCMECNAIHTGVDCKTYKDLVKKGDTAKLKELMEKDKNNGWQQLNAYACATGIKDVQRKLENADIVKSTMEFECPICFTDVQIGDGVILQECLHMFCSECLINLVEHNDEPTVKCPYIDGNFSCECHMLPREIKKLAPAAIYEKHLQRSSKLGESSISNSFHCKTPDCPGWVEYEVEASKFDCPVCKKTNCIECKALHKGSCEDYKNKLKQNENEKLTAAALEKLIKNGEYMRCPKCKIPVQKASGCDWIQCSACRMEICWVTRGPRWGPKGFGDVSAGCRCKVNGKKCHPKCGNCH